MNQLAKFLPHNPMDFENEMRALIVSHMGLGQGNPTQWVVSAVCEAHQRGFGVGFASAGGRRAPAPTAVVEPRPAIGNVARQTDVIEMEKPT